MRYQRNFWNMEYNIVQMFAMISMDRAHFPCPCQAVFE